MNTIQNNITDVLVERLKSTGTSVEVVLPDLMADYRPKKNQVVVTPETTTRFEDYDCQGNPPAWGWSCEYTIRCLTRQDENATPQSVDAILSEMSSNVYNSITSPSAWWQFDGNAINSQISGIERNLESLGMADYTITLTVQYRTDENNIFNRR